MYKRVAVPILIVVLMTFLWGDGINNPLSPATSWKDNGTTVSTTENVTTGNILTVGSPNGSTGSCIDWYDSTGANATGMCSPTTGVTGNYTFPSVYPVTTEYLSVNASGVWSWTSAVRSTSSAPSPNCVFSGAGTSPTVCTVTGTNNAMLFSLTPGTTPSGSAQITAISWSGAPPTSGGCTVNAANPAAVAISNTSGPYVSSVGASTMALAVTSTALINGTAYKWYIVCG